MSTQDVLGVLEDDECRLWAAFARAVELAQAERARLTLAKTTNPGLLMRWFAPAATQWMALSPDDLDFGMIASHRLAITAEFVPASIPVTTLLLGKDTGRALIELIRSGRYDTLVLTDVLLAHNRRLRRELKRLDLRTVLPSHRPASLASVPWRTPDRESSAISSLTGSDD